MGFEDDKETLADRRFEHCQMKWQTKERERVIEIVDEFGLDVGYNKGNRGRSLTIEDYRAAKQAEREATREQLQIDAQNEALDRREAQVAEQEEQLVHRETVVQKEEERIDARVEEVNTFLQQHKERVDEANQALDEREVAIEEREQILQAEVSVTSLKNEISEVTASLRPSPGKRVEEYPAAPLKKGHRIGPEKDLDVLVDRSWFSLPHIKSFTGGFVDTNNAAMDVVDQNEGKIPADQCSHENIELQNQKSASYAYNGYTGDKVCTDCGTKMETGTVTAKLDHTPVSDNAVPATCEQEGKTEGVHCSVCNTVLVAQATTPALGYEYSDYYTVTEMTCTVDGVQRKDCERDGCDHYETLTTTAPGHKEVADKAVAPTCTKTVLTEGEHCSRCDYKIAQTIAALGHVDVSPADSACDRYGIVNKEVDGLGDVEVNEPDAEITYDPDTGDTSGIVPPAEDEPETSAEIPEEDLPTTIEFNFGYFESSTKYTPGTYATVPYDITYTATKFQVEY